MESIHELAAAWKKARHAVVLTGAGASTDSGLPDFRSRQGLWQNVDPMKLASMAALKQSPVEFYQFYRMRFSRLRDAAPNHVHHILAELQDAGRVHTLMTQNVDGLHQLAGARDVIELHGNLRETVCLGCRQRQPSELIDVDVTSPADLPHCPECGGTLKPGVILFGEPLPVDAFDRAVAAAEQADLFVVIGSSLEVSPVNQLPAVAARGGAHLAILNLEPTHLDQIARWVIGDRAATVLDHCRSLMGL